MCSKYKIKLMYIYIHIYNINKLLVYIITYLHTIWFNLSYSYVYLFTGPYGEQDDEQVFVQKVMPETSELFVRLASNGKR